MGMRLDMGQIYGILVIEEYYVRWVMFLEIHCDRRRKTPYYYGLFREYVSKNGQPGRRTRGRVSGLAHQQLLALRDFLKSGCPSSPLQGCQIKDSREFGAVHAVLEVLKDLGLDKAIYSRRETWVRHVLAMIVGRVVYQGSKLALTNLWRDTTLWSRCALGDERPDVDDCYAAMDRLLQRQPKIQKTLARKHLKNGCLVLYMVGDRGMLTSARLPELSKAGLGSITALTHGQIQQLLKRKVIEVGLFDEKHIAEVYDPDEAGVRYMLCRNPLTAEKERKTRDALMAKTTEALKQLARSRRKRTNEELAAAVGKQINRWKVSKLFRWEIRNQKLTWELNETLLEQERAFDGCYVIRTDVCSEMLDKAQTVDCYKGLSVVEDAFRQMKTVLLEIRPTYHHRDDRIEAHVLVCMLAYYIQWHMLQRLARLFDADGEGKDRRWSFAGVLERLKTIRQQTVALHNSEVVLQTTPDDEQQWILDLLGVAM